MPFLRFPRTDMVRAREPILPHQERLDMGDNTNPGANRRDFLKTATVAAGAAVVSNLSLAPAVHAAGSDQIKVGIVGCGGRGTGAGENVLNAARGVTIYALGDVFKF